jgi:PAS domain S-box-containing protein
MPAVRWHVSFVESLRAKILGSLRFRVILGVCLILVTVIGVFTYWDMVTRTRFHLRREESKAFEFSNMVMRSIEYPMLDGEMEDVQEILERVNALEYLDLVHLCDPTGLIRYSGKRKAIGRPTYSEITKEAVRAQLLAKGLELRFGEQIFRYAMPIYNKRVCHKCHGSEKKTLGFLTVGIAWKPIENRVTSIRNREILLGIVSIVVVGFFLIRLISKSVTRPIVQLTRLTGEISRGNLDVSFDFGKKVKCWEVMKCHKIDCPAHGDADALCWYIEKTLCTGSATGEFPEKLEACYNCKVYKIHGADEIVQLADGFSQMTNNLKASREELRRMYDFRRNLIEGSIDGIVASDKKGNIVIFNEGAEKIFQCAGEEVIGKMDVADLYPPGQATKIREDLYSDEYGGPGKLANYEATILNKSGREVPVWISASIIYEYGKVLGNVVFFRDLTKRKALEKRVLQSERLATIGQGVAYISHEVKNPLTVIGGFAKQVLRKTDQDGKNKKKLEIIINETRRLEEFVSGVSGFTKLSKPKKRIASINKVIEEVCALLNYEFEAHHITVTKSFDLLILKASFDPKQIKQVLINIVRNAVEAMAQGGALSIETYGKGDTIEIRISDTGKGISPESLKDIFDPFVTTKPKGTGIGLAISREIIDSHEGNIEIRSTVGEGTICTITLPA